MSNSNDQDNQKLKGIFGDFFGNIFGGDDADTPRELHKDPNKTEPGWHDGARAPEAELPPSLRSAGTPEEEPPRSNEVPAPTPVRPPRENPVTPTMVENYYSPDSLARLTQAENQLFMDWEAKRRYRGFVRDGAVGPDQFTALRDKPKVIMMFREARSDDSDLRLSIANARPQELRAWERAARVASVFLNSPYRASPENTARILNEIVVLNLKKTPRGYAAYDNEINDFVRSNQPFIWRQLRLYHADVILGCGMDVCELLHDDVFQEAGGWKDDPGAEIRYFWTRRASEDRKTLVVQLEDPLIKPEGGNQGDPDPLQMRLQNFWSALMSRIMAGGEEQL